MLKLTRLNNQVVVVNPDLVYAVDATPDTTLRIVGGETIIVRESLDELIAKVVAFRRLVAWTPETATKADRGDDATLTLRHDGDGAGAAALASDPTTVRPRSWTKGDA